MNASATLEELQTLPVEEQLDFVFRAWDQIVESGWQPQMPPELKSEIERRLAAIDADPSRAIPWDEAVASIRRRQ